MQKEVILKKIDIMRLFLRIQEGLKYMIEILMILLILLLQVHRLLV